MKLMKTVILTTSALSLVATSAHAAKNEPKPEETIGYYLPKTTVTAVVTQRLAKCPDGTNNPVVITQTSIVPIGVADRFVQIDTRSGALADRSTKITTRSNGTIETFNAKTVGQGGQLLGAVAKLAFSLVGMSVGAPPLLAASAGPPNGGKLACKPEVTALLTALAAKNKQIIDIEDRIAKNGAGDADLPFLERLQTQAARIRTALTLSTQATFDPSNANQHLKRVAYERWFNTVPDNDAVMGALGFNIGAEADTKSPSYQVPDDAAISLALSKATSNLVYRRPVPVKITLAPCETLIVDSCITFNGNIDAKDMTNEIIVPAAQYSRLYSLKVGKGGMFGSRQAAAKFDEFGMPLELDYGTSAGASEMAGVVDTVRDGIKTIDDAELNELDKQIKIEKARKELAELRDPEGDGG